MLPSQEGGVTRLPRIFGTSYMRKRSRRENNNQFATLIKLQVGKTFTRSTTNGDARSVCGIANFLLVVVRSL